MTDETTDVATVPNSDSHEWICKCGDVYPEGEGKHTPTDTECNMGKDLEAATGREDTAITLTTEAPSATGALTLSGKYATTAKKGKPSKAKKVEPNILLAYAISKGGTVELTEETKKELADLGLKPERIPNAVYGLRTIFNLKIETQKKGRTAYAYVFTL